MIKAFYNMSMAGNNIDITLLSEGIYIAMVTTVGGLLIGIPAYFAYNYLASKIGSIVNSMARSDGITCVSPVVKGFLGLYSPVRNCSMIRFSETVSR